MYINTNSKNILYILQCKCHSFKYKWLPESNDYQTVSGWCIIIYQNTFFMQNKILREKIKKISNLINRLRLEPWTNRVLKSWIIAKPKWNGSSFKWFSFHSETLKLLFGFDLSAKMEFCRFLTIILNYNDFFNKDINTTYSDIELWSWKIVKDAFERKFGGGTIWVDFTFLSLIYLKHILKNKNLNK